MRKIFITLFAVFVLFFGCQSIMAVDNDYKNSLLKIQIDEIDQSDYNIELYTQKVYTEPVKIIKKSDTIYYFLLPETSHSITSVPVVGAIKNVFVKSYPYAGQDMNNGYTKVAIVTSKPVNLTTSLRTLDPSISPKLDPSRLARLDNVFERYSQRLAQNNIQSPLNEFRKTASASTPVMKSNVNVPSGEKIASSKNLQAKSLEDYQNKVNKQQTAQKQPTQVKKTNPKLVTSQTAPVKNVSSQKQTAKAPVKPQPKAAPASKPVQVATKPATKPVQSSKPVTKPVQVASKPATKPVQTTPKQAVSSNMPEKIAKAETKPIQTSKPVQVASKPATKPVSADVPADTKPATQPIKETKEPLKVNKNLEKIKEIEKQIVNSKPIDVEFSQSDDKAKVVDETATAQAEQPQPVSVEQTPNVPEAPIAPAQNNNQALLMLISASAVLLLLLANIIRKKNLAKANVEATHAQNPEDVQNMLQRAIIKPQTPENQAYVADIQPQQAMEQEVSIPSPVQNVQEYQNNEIVQNQPVYNEVVEKEPLYDETSSNIEQQKIDAFNSYMETIEDEHEEPVQITSQTPDDVVIEQLYTPISSPAYMEDNEPASYEEPIPQEVDAYQEDNDVATIVSSSKLTETRGLYLAKFEGATSLVGYIQDDIYVLYNFGDVELKETDIESSLAQENDTDSIYIVKTGGKKLMVKSTPYEMSLEMVM